MSKIVFLLILGYLMVTFVDLSPVCRSVQGVTNDWCCVRGRWYQNGARINFSKLYSCRCSKCVNGVQKTYYNDCKCDSKTTTSTATTTTTTTTTQGCTKDDEYEGKNGNWCYGAKCIDGKLVQWDNFNCGETTTTTTRRPTTRPGCTKDDEYEGKDGNWCYGAKCIDGKLVQWDNFNCGETTTTTTTRPTTTPGCTKDDEYEGKSGNWCYGAKCINGKLVHWDNFNCGETTTQTTTPTTKTTTTTTRPTTTPGCTKNDEYEGKSGNWCYGARCIDGKLVHWDNFNCGETTTPTTKTTTTTTRPTTTPGCTKDDEYEGKNGNWCYGAKCIGGKLVYWDNFNCGETTTQTTTPTTTTKTTTTTTRPTTTPGCTKDDEYEGKNGNWCYGAKCIDGKLVQWDNFNCGETTTTTTTTRRPTTRPGCTKDDEYEGKNGNWCYGAKCINGKLVHWDNFNCGETTTQTTTPTTKTSTTTTWPTTTPGCTKHDEYEGKNGNWCYGAKCIDGKLVHWDNFNCGETTTSTTTTTTPTTTTIRTTTPLQCSYEGRNYPPGTWIERTTCGGLYCDENGDLLHHDTKAFFEGADCVPFSETTVKVSSTERTITSTVRPS